MQPTRTALIVAVPAAEPVVAPWRARFDRAACWGVPAHITVLHPFLAPERIDDTVLQDLRGAIRAVPRFDITLSHVDWFGDRVLWLAPEPDDGLRALTYAVWRRFPRTPPYEGAFDDVVPHLTIGHDADPDQLRRAADAVSAHLPIAAPVHRVRLVQGTEAPDSWRTVAELPLGGPRPATTPDA